MVDVPLGFLAAAQESWRRARTELEAFLKEQPENYNLIGNLALTDTGLRDKASALALAERAIAVILVEKDALSGPIPIDVFARAAAQVGEPDRAIAAFRRLLSIPHGAQYNQQAIREVERILKLNLSYSAASSTVSEHAHISAR